MRTGLLLLVAILAVNSVDLFAQSPVLTGTWNFEADVNRLVGTDGFLKKTSVTYEWIIRLKQSGTKLTGAVVGGRGGTKLLNPCKDAGVEGTIRGRNISLVISWQGTCCPGEQSKFYGELNSDGSISGKVEPVDVPTDFGCSLEYADVTAAKGDADSDAQTTNRFSNLGIWDFQLDVDRMVGRDGFIKRVSTIYELVVRLNEKNGKVTGEIIGGRGGRPGSTVCADASIDGSVIGNRINFIVTFNGSCCTDEQLKFTGQFSADSKTMTGSMAPVDVPKGFCSLEYGEFAATKR